jgi:hypothetical protein
VHNVVVAILYQPLQTVQLCGAKTILLSQTGIFFWDFSSSNFIVHGHILTTAGDALSINPKP